MRARQIGLASAAILLVILAGCTTRTSTPAAVTSCPPGKDCSATSLTATAAVVTPSFGDLGWGEVRGRVSDTITGAGIAGATVTCKQRSNHPVSLCSGSVKTAEDGSFVFAPVFFQASDQIEMSASDPRYGGNFLRQEFFTQPKMYVNFSLPVVDRTPKPCCTAPACREDEVYFCQGVCPCGCGTTCATKTMTPYGFPTETPVNTPTPFS